MKDERGTETVKANQNTRNSEWRKRKLDIDPESLHKYEKEKNRLSMKKQRIEHLAKVKDD